MFKRLLSTFLCCAIFSQSAYCFIPGEQAFQLSTPFQARGNLYLSPVEGFDPTLVTGLRYHGHFGNPTEIEPEAQEIPRIPYERAPLESFPLDPISFLIEWLFPAWTPGVLAVNNIGTTPVRLWLTPKNVGQLVAVLNSTLVANETELTDLQSQILEIITPERWGKKVKKKTREIYKTNTLAFSYVLASAFSYVRDLDFAASPFYFPHIIERLLITEMVMTASDAQELIPYYESLFEHGLIDEFSAEIFTAQWGKENHERLWGKIRAELADQNSPKATIRALVENPEMLFLLSWGLQEHERSKLLPSLSPYRTAFYEDGKSYGFSNCVEAASMNFVLALTYDWLSGSFSTLPFCESLKKYRGSFLVGVEAFLQELTPTNIKLDITHNRWVSLVSNLNDQLDIPPGRRVIYKKYKGQYAQPERAVYEIRGESRNFFRLIGVLLGHPEGWHDLHCGAPSLAEAMANNLDMICRIFSISGRKLKWRSIDDTEQVSKVIANPSDIKIQFYYGGESQFFVHIERGHGELFHVDSDFNEELHKLYKEYIYMASHWHPFMESIINSEAELFDAWDQSIYNTKPQPTLCLKDYAKGKLLAIDTSSISGRSSVLQSACNYKKIAGQTNLDCWILRWLTPGGEKFAEWSDPFTNRSILETLGLRFSLDWINALGIDAFTIRLNDEITDEEVNRLIMSYTRPQEISGTTQLSLLLSQLENLDRLVNIRLHHVEFTDSSLSSSDDDSNDGEYTSSSEESSNGGHQSLCPHNSLPPSSRNPLHLLVDCDLTEGMRYVHASYPEIFREWADENWDGNNGHHIQSSTGTPIACAVKTQKWQSALVLQELGVEFDPEALSALFKAQRVDQNYATLLLRIGITPLEFLEKTNSADPGVFSTLLQGTLPDDPEDLAIIIGFCSSPNRCGLLKILMDLGLSPTAIIEYYISVRKSEAIIAQILHSFRGVISTAAIQAMFNYFDNQTFRQVFLEGFSADESEERALFEALQE